MYLGILFVLETMTRFGLGFPIDPLYFYMVYTLIILSHVMRKKDDDAHIDYQCFLDLFFLVVIHLIGYPPITIATVLLIGLLGKIVAGRGNDLQVPLLLVFFAYMVNLCYPASLFALDPNQIYCIIFSTQAMLLMQLTKCKLWMIKETQGDDKIDHILLNLCASVRLFLTGKSSKALIFMNASFVLVGNIFAKEIDDLFLSVAKVFREEYEKSNDDFFKYVSDLIKPKLKPKSKPKAFSIVPSSSILLHGLENELILSFFSSDKVEDKATHDSLMNGERRFCYEK